MNQTHLCSDIPVAILAGGLGSRLRPALADCPKPLAPVGGRPFVAYLFDQLAEASFRRVVLLTGYRAGQIRQTLGINYAGMTLAYSHEATPLGTGGAVRQALPLLTGSTVLLMNGDSFCEIDLVHFVAEHRRRRAEMSMVLAQVPDTSRFGAVGFQDDGTITRFVEKQGGSGPGWINAGIYLLESTLASEIPPGQPISLERDMLPIWLTSRHVVGIPSSGRFLDIGTPSSYAEAERFFDTMPGRRLILTG